MFCKIHATLWLGTKKVLEKMIFDPPDDWPRYFTIVTIWGSAGMCNNILLNFEICINHS